MARKEKKKMTVDEVCKKFLSSIISACSEMQNKLEGSNRSCEELIDLFGDIEDDASHAIKEIVKEGYGVDV